MELKKALRISSFRSVYHMAGLNILYTNYWLSEQFNQVFKAFDISEQQYNVLRILKGQDRKKLHLGEIQQRMIHKNSNATRLVEKLRIRGLVNRVRCPENRRMVEIGITKQGLSLLDDIEPVMIRTEKDIFSNFPEEDAALLSRLLDKLRK